MIILVNPFCILILKNSRNNDRDLAWTKTGQILDKTGYENVEIQAALWYNKFSTIKASDKFGWTYR